MDGENLNIQGKENGAQSPPLGEIIGKLMADPEIMKTLSSVIGKKDTAADQAQPTEAKEASAAEETAPVSSGASEAIDRLPEVMAMLTPALKNGKIPERNDRRTCLLRAIKPYVSRGRCEAIDYMIRIAGISDILKNLN